MKKHKEKKKICDKCGVFFWIDVHHILPKAVFGAKGDTANLCPNCHRDYHEKLGRENLKNPDETFHYEFFAKWIAGGLGILLLLSFWLWR